MARSRKPRVGRVRRLLERVVLATFFTIAVFLLERRLKRALGKATKRKRQSVTVELG